MGYASIKASSKGGGKDFEPIPAGVHFAICNKVIFLGYQEVEYKGEFKVQPKVWIGFEFPDVTREFEDKQGNKKTMPMVAGREFTLNIGEKSNLGPFLVSWRGRAFTEAELESFEITSIAGKPCQISIIHVEKNGKTYANINAAIQLGKDTNEAIKSGARSLKTANEVVVYNPYEHDQHMWELIPEFLQKKIDDRVDEPDSASGTTAPQPLEPEYNDDIPF